MIGSPTIPLAETASFLDEARRTAIVRLVLAGALVLSAVASIVVARRLQVTEEPLFASGKSGIVVLDLSSSLEAVPAPELGAVLRRAANGHGRVGLVLFSDVAYEALPSSASSVELRSYLRFFRRPPGAAQPGTPQPRSVRRSRTVTPWTRAFRGGTRVSAGLELARQIIHEHPSRTRDVLLVSDLNDSLFDIANLTTALLEYRQEGIQLRVVPLGAAEANRAFFARRLGHDPVIHSTEVLRPPRHTTAAASPRLLVALTILLAVLLGANELACARLEWRTT